MYSTLDSEGKPSFKLSMFVYEDVGMKSMAKKILSHIIWLLEETQKADSTSQSRESRE
jgi:hypothetical protein